MSRGVGAAGEFGFELRACRWLERHWPLDGHGSPSVVLARQLGTRRRRWDIVIVESTVQALEARAAFGPRHLDSDLRHVLGNAPSEWTYYRDAVPEPGYPWRYVREAIHEADERGILDVRKRSNRIEIRERYPYPDWVERLVAVENKPDLDASAARALTDQLEHDVAVALADEVWVATRPTGSTLEPALREALPPAVGIVALEPDELEGEVLWFARRLAVDEPGTRILERPDGGTHDGSAARFEYLDADEKERHRIGIAERAYERGWRSFHEAMRPDCRHFGLDDRDGLVPRCGAHGRVQSARECSGSCPSFEPEPPAWRTRGWPLEGGPGAASRRLLEARRRRQRPGLE